MPSTALVRFFVGGALHSAVSFSRSGFAVPAALSDYMAKSGPRGGPQFAAFAASLGATEVGKREPAAEEKEFDFRLDVTEGAPDVIVLREWTNDAPVFAGTAQDFKKHADKGFGQC
jgi:hypothetical protein